MKSRIALIVIGLCLLIASAKAQDRSDEKQALRNLLGAVVLISISDKEPRLARHANKDELRRFVESELERGGLMLGKDKDLLRNPPTLAVMLEARQCDSLLVVRIDTTLIDSVMTTRDPDTPFSAEIWSESYSVFLSAQDDDAKIKRVIRTALDIFIEDWKQANPPRKEKVH